MTALHDIIHHAEDVLKCIESGHYVNGDPLNDQGYSSLACNLRYTMTDAHDDVDRIISERDALRREANRLRDILHQIANISTGYHKGTGEGARLDGAAGSCMHKIAMILGEPF